jgi:hypothetical protein
MLPEWEVMLHKGNLVSLGGIVQQRGSASTIGTFQVLKHNNGHFGALWKP